MQVWFKYFRWIWCILLNLFNIAQPTHIFITVDHSSNNTSMMDSHSLSMVSPYFHNLIKAKHVWHNSQIRQQNFIFRLHHWCHYVVTTYHIIRDYKVSMQQQKQVNLRQYQQQYNLLQQPVQLLSNIQQEINAVCNRVINN